MLSIANPDGTGEQNTYSADGLRKSKTSAGTTTNFTWDDQNLLLETNTSNVIKARNTDFPGYWGGLASQNRSGTSSFYLYDSQGSVRNLVSTAGAITDSYVYTAFGVELLTSGSTINPFRYVGLYGYYLEFVNMYYVRERWLDATIANWKCKDRIPNANSVLDYLYVLNSPIVSFDPSGLKPPASSTGPTGNLKPTTSYSEQQGAAFSGCCKNYMDYYKKLKNDNALREDFLNCLNGDGKMQGGVRSGDAVAMSALEWLANVCGPRNKSSEVCIWCIPDALIVPGLQGTCPSIVGQALAPAAWRGRHPSPPITGDYNLVNCTSFMPNYDDPGQKLGGSLSGDPHCAVVGICKSILAGGTAPWPTEDQCSVLFHEIIHTGGPGHGPDPTIVDLVRAMTVCLCKKVYPGKKCTHANTQKRGY